ncbi:MAG: hypothetical protein WCQ90_10765 [Deltaproteobacteria bacterium]
MRYAYAQGELIVSFFNPGRRYTLILSPGVIRTMDHPSLNRLRDGLPAMTGSLSDRLRRFTPE